MATTFIVEDGSGKSDANAFVSVVEADQITENYGASTAWSGATEAVKQNAIREATWFMNMQYSWKGYRYYTTQSLQWPRYECYDDEGNYIDVDVVPERVKEACAYLALKVVGGSTLLEDLENASTVKRTKDVIGPLTEEIEYVKGEEAGVNWQIADKLVSPYVELKSFLSDLYRA